MTSLFWSKGEPEFAALKPETHHIFAVSDALNMNLYDLPNKKVKGAATSKFKVGDFWEFHCDTLVESDAMNSLSSSYFVRYAGNLWAYMVSSSKGMWNLFFDGDRAKVRVGACGEVGTGSIKETLKKLQPALRDGYVYDDTEKVWKPIDVADMVAQLGAGNADSAGSSPAK